MKAGFYQRLAWTGIQKNAQLYLPYLFTCGGMVMMSYIFSFLWESPVLGNVSGGGIITSVMGLGFYVIAFFSIIFLYYTHSFLIRRRQKEFGLYNILGMGKLNLARVLIWETAITAVLALAGGLLAGMALSKLAELGMVNLLSLPVDFTLRLEPGSILRVAKLFGCIFLVLLGCDLWTIRLSSPVELLHTENMGEKPPKANFLLAIAGVVLLGIAYYMALTITDPVSALLLFFFAVLLVIAATYLLFVSGSVALCRLLQKNKRFYYKTQHFVSVSSMAFRMKRSGEGLASICILCTMVLVMISSTFCLYIGAESSILDRYPNSINLRVSFRDVSALTDDMPDPIRAVQEKVLARRRVQPEATIDYRAALLSGVFEDGVMDITRAYSYGVIAVSDLYIVPLADYNRSTGESQTLEPGQALVYCYRGHYTADTFTIQGVATLQVKQVLDRFPVNASSGANASTSLYLVVDNWESFIEPMRSLANFYGDPLVTLRWYSGMDLAEDDDRQAELYEELYAAVKELTASGQVTGFSSFSYESRAAERIYYYGMFGSLLFLGVLLGAVFLCAVVLIMYYKQLSEGYEDQNRFLILQKVGMTKQEIRRSVNSQILLLFFLPLAAAGVHLIFAFPMLRAIMVAFGLTNIRLFILVTLACFILFAILYAAVYLVTSRTYYRIVSSTDPV